MYDSYTGEVRTNCPECWLWVWWMPDKGMCDDCFDADTAYLTHMERISYLLKRANDVVEARQNKTRVGSL